MEKKELKRGQVLMVDLGSVTEYSGSLQKGLRACIIISNDVACKYSPIITVVPLTTRYTKRPIPTHYMVCRDNENNLLKDSIALCEQIITLNKTSLGRYIGQLSSRDMNSLNHHLGISMGLTLATN